LPTTTTTLSLLNPSVETEQEIDGRWIAEIPELSGAMKYGRTRDEAIAHVEALALRVVAERLENGEQLATPIQISFAAA
jgi:predicted RNase H-like HicB family nuclease